MTIGSLEDFPETPRKYPPTQESPFFNNSQSGFPVRRSDIPLLNVAQGCEMSPIFAVTQVESFPPSARGVDINHTCSVRTSAGTSPGRYRIRRKNRPSVSVLRNTGL